MMQLAYLRYHNIDSYVYLHLILCPYFCSFIQVLCDLFIFSAYVCVNFCLFSYVTWFLASLQLVSQLFTSFLPCLQLICLLFGWRLKYPLTFLLGQILTVCMICFHWRSLGILIVFECFDCSTVYHVEVTLQDVTFFDTLFNLKICFTPHVTCELYLFIYFIIYNV